MLNFDHAELRGKRTTTTTPSQRKKRKLRRWCGCETSRAADRAPLRTYFTVWRAPGPSDSDGRCGRGYSCTYSTRDHGRVHPRGSHHQAGAARRAAWPCSTVATAAVHFLSSGRSVTEAASETFWQDAGLCSRAGVSFIYFVFVRL